MTPLFELSELARSLFSLWALLLSVIGIFIGVLAAAQKQYRCAALALLPFGCSYFAGQVLFDLHLFGVGKEAVAVSRALGVLPWIVWLAFFGALTPAALFLLVYVIRYEKRSITPTAVKHCLDQIPCGVCCWRDNGRLLFSNNCMNRLCAAVTGGPPLNGNHFRDAVKGGIPEVDGKRWRFICRDLDFNGDRLHEMIASDITAEYARTQALEKDKAELSRLNRELREYALGIDETVRRKEILQAKVNIHDEMNRLMLSTMAAESGDTAALDQIFSLWERNALLLCMEADEVADTKATFRIEKLAAALKIRLIWQDALPTALTEKQRNLFYSAAQEAIANAAKHAGAKTIEISFEETAASVCCVFRNDGRLPDGEVRFAGGLANLSRLAEKQNARLSVQCGKTFALFLIFPRDS